MLVPPKPACVDAHALTVACWLDGKWTVTLEQPDSMFCIGPVVVIDVYDDWLKDGKLTVVSEVHPLKAPLKGVVLNTYSRDSNVMDCKEVHALNALFNPKLPIDSTPDRSTFVNLMQLLNQNAIEEPDVVLIVVIPLKLTSSKSEQFENKYWIFPLVTCPVILLRSTLVSPVHP